ncbi:glycosyltransferase family 2 protein [bacterium 210820-DFI.6.52]|nr:glycosyltransferase family 2 protein [bacterium 210820-DFI.6.52]
MNKILSVVVPSYNVEGYIKKGLESFVNTKVMEQLEVIIVDDGSSDQTAQIAEMFVNKYPQTFFLISKENGGHGSAVNTGIKHATGKYFKIVDGDDWVETKNLESFLSQLTMTNAELVLTDYQTVHMQTGKVQKCLFDKLDRNREYTVEQILHSGILFPMATLCYRTDILQKNNIWLQEKTFYVDEEFDVLPFIYIKKVFVSDLLIYNYLIGNSNQSVFMQNQILRLEDKKRVTRRLVKYLAENRVINSNYQYCFYKVKGAVESVFLISLIYDEKPIHGRKGAVLFYKEIKALNLEMATAVRKKFVMFWVLNHFSNRKNLYCKIKQIGKMK